MDTKINITLAHKDNRIIRRIMNNLLSILDQNKGFHQKVLDIGIASGVPTMMNGISKEEFLKGIENSTKIQNALDNDIYSMFLSILEEVISYKSSEKYRKKLIEAKYCILLAHKNMETMFIGTNFDISDNIYISSKILNELLNEPEISYNFIKRMKLKSTANYNINILLNLTDSDYSDDNTFFNSIIIACQIRALLSLMEGNTVDTFNQEIHDILESPKYLSKHLNDRISENIIISCFKYFKKDREKVRTLSSKR